MSGRHTGVFTIYGPNGEITQAMPPTGKRFATTQTHWMRVKDGKVIEHWANRDDQGTAMQLGWIPPSPWYLVKMALATRRARKHSAAGTSDGAGKPAAAEEVAFPAQSRTHSSSRRRPGRRGRRQEAASVADGRRPFIGVIARCASAPGR